MQTFQKKTTALLFTKFFSDGREQGFLTWVHAPLGVDLPTEGVHLHLRLAIEWKIY